MARLFGTDGVRGVANTELTGELAFRLGRAGAYVLTKETKHAPRILVAMDTRISGDMLESALVSRHLLRRRARSCGRGDPHACGCVSGKKIQTGCRCYDFRIP